ncbi:MAG: SRPBCC domain-containing protein [Alphaproteobacteria bacterium]|nr:SRPBCC domain-containing protein [Alphaproteobacteria bacterium]MCB9930122.1 SRPBCC domain-containing protein [Alphaproteobacteria bacterium]
MADDSPATPSGPFDLSIELRIEAPRDKVWRCWTEGPLMERWFAPPPWTTPKADLEARAGGHYFVLMRSPDGVEIENRGVFLDMVPGERLVFTDAYTEARNWTPSADPFLTAIVTFADAGHGATLFRLWVRHWTREARDTHIDMGFKATWTAAVKQLEAVARTL